MATAANKGVGSRNASIGQGAGIRPYKLDLVYASTTAFLAAKGAGSINSSSAAEGDWFYDSTLNCLQVYDGANWQQIAASGAVQYAEVAVSSAEILALFTTPKSLVAAPGAGKVLEFLSATVILDYGAATYAAAGILTVKYTNGAGTAVSDAIAAADLVQLTADGIRQVQALSADVALTANAPLVLTCDTGNPTTGDGVIRVKVAYRVHVTGL